MLPIVPILASRVGWVIAGAAVTALCSSKIGKEAVQTFKEGVKGMGEDYRRDMTPKQKQEVSNKEQMVKDIKAGRQ